MTAGAPGEVLTVAVVGLPGRPPADARRKGSGVVMVPEKLVERWETAYRRYGSASKAATLAQPGDPEAARAMAAASRDMAAMWREIESTPDLPWWALAALAAAAQAFEFQARDWTLRVDFAFPPEVTTPRRPRVRLTTRAQPRREQGDGAGGSDG